MMQPRLPLYAKILLWFFLNLVLLATVFALLFNAQFNLNLDWLLATGARERIDAIRDLIVGELNTTSPDEWPEVMARYGRAHRVQFALYDDAATEVVGEIATLPPAVRKRILDRPEYGRSRRTRSGDVESIAPGPATPARSEAGRGRWRPPIRTLMRTTDPTRYWLLTSARVENPLAGDPLRVILVASAPSISGGGLIFDPKPWIALGLGAAAFSVLFWFPLVRGITRSVSRMKEATQEIAAGRFDVRIHMRRSDELGSLGESIDQMAARLDGLVKGQKRFLGDIAHELCSPLAKLQMALGILEQRARDGEKAYVSSATEKAAEIARLVGELLSFSKASFGESALRLEHINIAEAVHEAIRRELPDDAGTILDIPDDLAVVADHDLLLRALGNLLRNAVRHTPTGAPVTVKAISEGHVIAIAVKDDGPGVPDEELPRIFDAFYRTDLARTRETGGTGLGLTIVKTCIESCDGTVSARNRHPHGLEVQIRLPSATL